MKLYYLPGACSLAVHIVLEETGLEYQAYSVDRKTRETEDGRAFAEINPLGYIPALVLDDGRVLTEGPVINQYLADQVPDARLIGPAGSWERLEVQMWLNFISTELHKSYSPLFMGAPDAWCETMRQKLASRFAYLEEILKTRDWLVGERFSIADAYLFVMLLWGRKLQFDFIAAPALNHFFERVFARDSVQEAMKAEGLLSEAPSPV